MRSVGVLNEGDDLLFVHICKKTVTVKRTKSTKITRPPVEFSKGVTLAALKLVHIGKQ
jgi:hypothetical protein